MKGSRPIRTVFYEGGENLQTRDALPLLGDRWIDQIKGKGKKEKKKKKKKKRNFSLSLKKPRALDQVTRKTGKEEEQDFESPDR